MGLHEAARELEATFTPLDATTRRMDAELARAETCVNRDATPGG